jgi:hypothetical protein
MYDYFRMKGWILSRLSGEELLTIVEVDLTERKVVYIFPEP